MFNEWIEVFDYSKKRMNNWYKCGKEIEWKYHWRNKTKKFKGISSKKGVSLNKFRF